MMTRATLVTAVTSALLAYALAAGGQNQKVWRIGYLTPFSLTGLFAEAFRQGLRDYGYVEGRNVHIEARSSGQTDRLDDLAAELVAANVDLIFAQTGHAALAAKRATTRVPIVKGGSADAVAQGVVTSLARPGGNVTGYTLITTELVAKRVELLREAMPLATRVAVVWCPALPTNHAELGAADGAARRAPA